MIGYGFMGAAHSQGWRVAPRFFDLDAQPDMQVLVGRNAEAVADAATKWGWAETATDWREVIARDDIDIVDIVTPGGSHAEIAIAALNAGKHVLCEKPLANSVEEAELMAAAANAAATNGVISMLGHTYRRLPATTLARDLVAAGKIGEIHQVRACYLQDWLTDPETPLVWRLQKDLAGSGSLGDIGAHIIDLSEYITGTHLVEVSGTMETIIKQRPVLESTAGLGGTGGIEMGDVTVDDVALFTGRYDSGVLGSFEATRFATGRKNGLRIEISGSLGAISFDLERLNELQFFDATAPAETQGFTTILVTEPEHPYIAAWWPAGHMLGYEHAFSHQAKDFVDAVTSGTPASPSFDDGVHVQRVLAAVEESSNARSAWTTI
ncbi:Gfo/Idh/MocA family oxidoreductase [Salinibacterium sp. NSLL150]|uniref:Gfo/Idh/MocA family protein n=1 Tax=unclassified Salinibacterium TaxID=2632331 RepID=UPI0018CC7C6F|nr:MULTISPECIES: Gfo/Idh/MocA family oxidoreductase [unclassified Salinibacterium]MBH0099915.1 Gfo/Idh/MocA family oxidoreductase [Salinibacterium sp. NSLL35]MBH0102669.1 Gfo/Idh/MocA family oxidoreductase [Salinibacterium sp. NSLL150]MBH0105429.1 Gfo/Idh/MocA family oxidoreductase [Salinibacterium sp. NSLL16]MBH0108189.1 Gfo/Idh/MocA family oxidoreductase [Salinibacterium sp. NSLL17]